MSKMDMSRFSDLLGDLPADPPAEPIPAIADESQMARLLGVTANRVRTLTRDGLLVKAAPGRWDVRASLTRYLERLRIIAARAGAPAAGGGDADALRAERLRLTRAQADKEETRVQRERGELVPATDVEREWGNLLRDVRNALLAVPSRFSSLTPHLTPTDVENLDREIRAALEGLGNGN